MSGKSDNNIHGYAFVPGKNGGRPHRRPAVLAVIALAAVILAVFSFRAGVMRKAGSKAEEPAPHKESAVVALVLDDFGYTEKNLEALRDMGAAFTMAVLPNAPCSGSACSFAEENGTEVILHLPMEPKGETARLERDTIGPDMDEAAVSKVIEKAFLSVPTAVGVSNHMGSKATEDIRLMTVVLDDLGKRGMFFLDSFTTARSVCKRAALERAVPYARRDIFIDNVLEEEYIIGQLETLERMALAGGRAVAIGHDRGVTIDVLRRAIPKMREKGIRFVVLSELMTEGRE